MSTLNTIFAAENTTSSARILPGTATLTSLATALAQKIITRMNENIEEYSERISMSVTNNATLDTLIDELIPDYGEDADFLLDLDANTIDSMLKSQQSKRSRLKSKPMNSNTYASLMTAAIAERLIREKTNRSSNGSMNRGRSPESVGYTDEQLNMLAENQDLLRKELRNVQSKKSIMKGKADFSEDSDRWQALLKAEEQLKAHRIGGITRTVKVDDTKQKLAELFGNSGISDDDSINSLKAAQAKELLHGIYSLILDETAE